MKRVFTADTWIDASPEKIFEWHSRKGAVERLTPPWIAYEGLIRKGGLEEGAVTSLKLKAGPFKTGWTSVHTECREGSGFTDKMIRGPFRSFEHIHTFAPEKGGCRLTDRIEYELPLSRFGDILGQALIEKELTKMFRYRHTVTKRDLERYRACDASTPLTVVVSGASGIIGSSLVPFLTTGGHRVKRLVRRPVTCEDEIFWNPLTGDIESEKLEGTDVVIHLAGENIGEGYWSLAKKQRIIESRVKGTALLASAVSRLEKGPKLFLSASAVGFYGDRGDTAVTERDPHGKAFISKVSRIWEETARDHLKDSGIRLVPMRIGVVVTPAGGALSRMQPLFKAGLGGVIGNGSQYLSWISMEDVIGAIQHIIHNSNLNGPVNITAPEPLSNTLFSRKLAATLGRRVLIRVPSGIIRLLLGEMGEEVLLEGVRALPEKLTASGYRFVHNTLEEALEETTH